ncbi:MAG: transporter substrate-binding domain-containing protein [Burkholderiales bacterium]
MRALAVLLAAFAATLAFAATPAPLRLLAAELPPYTFQVPPATVAEVPGPGQGIVHDVVEELARRVGERAAIEYVPWVEAQRLALSGANVGILALTRTPERDAQYRWIAKIVTDDLVLVGRAGADVGTLDAARGRTTGVLRGSGAEVLLLSSGFTRIIPAAEEWVNAQRLRDGKIEAWLAPRLMVLHAYREVGGDPAKLAVSASVRPSEIWFAAGKGMPDAEAQKWQQAFAAMQADGTYARIMARYEKFDVRAVPDDLRRTMSGPLPGFPY